MAFYDILMSWEWTDESADGLVAYRKVIADIANKKLVKDMQAMGTDGQRIEDGFHPPRQHSAAFFLCPGDFPADCKTTEKDAGTYKQSYKLVYA